MLLAKGEKIIMKTFKIRAVETNYLKELEIEAESEDAAEEIYREKWREGNIESVDFDFNFELFTEGGDNNG
jgi:hypothetical protein